MTQRWHWGPWCRVWLEGGRLGPHCRRKTIAGHIIECGAQVHRRNCQADGKHPQFAGIGYPIVEAESDGTVLRDQHAGTGGRVNVPGDRNSCSNEIGRSRNYITPDGIADFSTIQLEQQAQTGYTHPAFRDALRPIKYKVPSAIRGFQGCGHAGILVARCTQESESADKILRERMERLGLRLDAIHSDFIGVNACHGQISGEPSNEIAEVVLRMARAAWKRHR